MRSEKFARTRESSPHTGEEMFHIEFAAVPENVGHARHAIAEFLHRRAWCGDEADAFLLAVGEACNNAVNYGGRDSSDPLFVVSCQPLDDLRLQIDVRNLGNGFHPDLGEYGQMPVSEFATHGRGFGLMLALVDDVQVLSDGVSTIVRLTKSKIA